MKVLGMEVGLSPSPPRKGGAEPLSPIFCPFLLWPLAKRFDTSRCHLGVGLSSGDFVLDGVPVFPPNKGGGAPLPIFGHSYCAQTAGCITMPLGMEVGLSPGEFVLDGDPVPLPKGGGGGVPSSILRVEVRISKLDRKCGALPIVATL